MSTGIVVGAAGGIGAACARVLDDCADSIVLAGRRREPLEAVAAELGRAAIVASGDVATAEGRAAILAAVKEPLAWVVLASGLPLRETLAALEEDEITAAFAANLVGPTLLVRSLLNMRWEERGAIAVIGSISASRSLPHRAVYGATKAGLEHLARSLAAEIASRGIRINVVAPGVIETPFLGADRSALVEWLPSRVPLGRLGMPDEVANVVRYVLVEAPEYLTGARIAVDGGAEVVA